MSGSNRSIQIRTLREDSGHDLMFLPPYSAFLNPIENLFSQWKRFDKNMNPLNKEHLLATIDQFILTEEAVNNYFRHAFEKCMTFMAGMEIENL